MPFHSEDVQFIEVSEITIRNLGRQSKLRAIGGNYRVVIEHEHGTKETIPSNESRPEVTIKCKTFIQLKSEATIHVYRANKFHSEADGTFMLSMTAAEDDVHTIILTGKREMSLILKLGKKMTVTQVAEARMQDANRVLAEGAKSAEELGRITGHVKCVVDALDVATSFDPFPFADGAVKLVKLVFDKMEITHKDYNALKDAALDCIAQIKFDEEARKVFTTEEVRKQLNAVMSSVLKALDFILAYYSQSRIDRFNSIFTKPSDSTINEIKDLTSELNREKEQTKNFFQLEIRGILQKIVDEPLLEGYLSSIGSIPKGKDPCLPGTRISILNRLSSWAQDDSPAAKRLFWLYGVAGCGKSSVVASTSQSLAEAKRLAGSFFCRRDESDRRNPVQLFSHLAASIAKKCAPFKSALATSMEEYRVLNNHVLSTFFEYAFRKQFSVAKNFTLPTTVTFLVDALDECEESSTVAKLLADIVAEIPWMKLIVASREQPEIESSFVSTNIPMDEHDLFTEDARSDVHEYLFKRFEALPDLQDYVDVLADKAGGLFIWLHTVTEIIIKAKFRREREQKVKAILEKPLSGSAEERMVEMYLFVLEQASGSSETGIAVVRMIVGLLLATSSNTPLTINGLYAFLPPSLAEELSAEEFGNLIMELKPVLKFTPVEESSEAVVDEKYRFFVQTYHASFLDFCEKQTIPYKTDTGVEDRLNPFWTDPTTLHRNMAEGCLEIMKKGKWKGEPDKAPFGLGFNICSLETSHKLNSEVSDLQERIESKISRHLLYSSLYWADHVLKSTPDGSALDIDVQEALGEFLETTRSLFWLEALSLTGNLAEGIEALISIAVDTKTKSFALIADEMSRFVEQCFPAISCSTPHLYLSFAWLPFESLLWRAWKTEFAGASILKTPIRQPSELLSSTPFPVRVDVFAVSPDSKYVVTGSRDGHVRLWSIRSGSLIKDRQIASEAVAIDALAYKPGRSHILCACDNFIYKLNTESLSDVEDRESIPYGNVRCMAIAHGQVAFGTEDGRVVSTPAKLYSEVEVHTRKRVDAIALSSDGSRLVYAADKVYSWKQDVGSGVFKHDDKFLKSFSSWVTALAFSLDGSKIAIGNWHGDIKLVDADSSKWIGRFEVKSPVQFFAFSYGNRVIAAIASKKRDVVNSKDLPPSSEGSRIYNFRRICCWAEETSLQIWNADFSDHLQTQSTGHTYDVTSVTFSPNGERIVSGSYDKSVRVWEAQTGEQVKLAEMLHSDWVRFVTFSPDGKFIASGGKDKVVRIWNALTGNPVRVLEGHAGLVLCGAYSPDGMRLVSGSDDGTLRFWNVGTENITSQELTGHVGGVNSVTFSPDGSLVASASLDSTIRLWDCKSWKAQGSPLMNGSAVHSVAFSPDGRHLVSGGADATVRIWDVKMSSAVGEPLKGHTDTVNSVAFSPNGTFIFSASKDETICCWEANSGNPIGRPLKGHSGHVTSLAVSPNGHRIVSGSWDCTIRVWDSQSFTFDTSFITCGQRGPDKIPNDIPEDGWIQTTEGRLLLWVPLEHRSSVCRLDEFAISTEEKLKPNRILWDELCHGEKWTNIRHAK